MSGTKNNTVHESQARLFRLFLYSIDTHFKNMERLLRISHVAPWELKPKHVVDFFESKVNKETGETISPATHAQYCSSFRSFGTLHGRVAMAKRTYCVFCKLLRFVG
jgi:hypothetical protein